MFFEHFLPFRGPPGQSVNEHCFTGKVQSCILQEKSGSKRDPDRR